MTDLTASSCWVITEKLAGLQNQAMGLAEALGLAYVFKEVPKRQRLWQYLFPDNYGFVPPWPDILISCGRQSAPASVYVRQANKGRTFTVHIQDPRMDHRQFDIIIAPAHDHLRGDNVLVTLGAIHHVNRQKLENGAQHFGPLWASLPRPLISVLIGGKNRHQNFPPESARLLAQTLLKVSKNTGGGLAITTSRRTGATNEDILRRHLQEVPHTIYNGRGENPYFGLLAMADIIITTSDSISMISEACFTGKPVYVFELPNEGKRHQEFLKDMVRGGMARPLTEKIETWTYPPFDETKRAADFVRQCFSKKSAAEQSYAAH